MQINSFFNKLKLNAVRWYEYNKHQIPVILTILASVLLTSTMRTHIKAITPLFSAESGFYMFVVMMFAALIMFTAFAYGKTQSLISTIVYSLISMAEIFFIISFIRLIHFETTTGVLKNGVNQVVNEIPAMNQSITIMIVSLVLYVLSIVFAWLYTNFKYVKVAD